MWACDKCGKHRESYHSGQWNVTPSFDQRWRCNTCSELAWVVCEVCGEDTYQFGRWVFTPSLIGEPLTVRCWDPMASREKRWICNKCADPSPICTKRTWVMLGDEIGRWVFTPSLIGDPLVAGWSLDGVPLDPWMVRRGDRTPARKGTPPPFVNQEDKAVEQAVEKAFVEKIVKKLFVEICEKHLLETCIDPATGIVVPTSQGIAAWLKATPWTRRSLVLMKNDHDLREHDLREQTEDLLPKKMAEDLLTNVLCDELLTCLMILYSVHVNLRRLMICIFLCSVPTLSEIHEGPRRSSGAGS
jgi:hypothetical protein